jgi:glutamyl-tRNA reductase
MNDAIGVVGISHQEGSLAQREAAALSVPRGAGLIPLVTCNRVELYVSGPERAIAHGWLAQLGEGAYAHWGAACFHHLALVTAGTKSALRGEADIQGQVKRAYQEAMNQGSLAAPLHYLFQKCLQLGKKVRTQVALYQTTPCYGPTVVELLQQHGSDNILVVGSSQVNQRIIAAAQAAGFGNITQCTRATGFEIIRRWWEYDTVICATRCPHVFIEKPVKTGGKKLLIDLSVPRNIDPALGTVWTLWGLDELHAKMAQQMPPRAVWSEVEAYLRMRVEKALERKFSAASAQQTA